METLAPQIVVTAACIAATAVLWASLWLVQRYRQTQLRRWITAQIDKAHWVPDPARRLTIYVGWPLVSPQEWRKVSSYNVDQLVLDNSTTVRPADAHSRLLVYPNNEVLGGRNVFEPLPAGLKLLEPTGSSRAAVTLDSDEVAYGRSICSVNHSRHRVDSGKAVYATSVTNRSNQRIRIERFAGLRRVGPRYELNTVTGNFFDGEQFIAWYTAPRDGWINPGASVADENNYGNSRGIWAFFGRTEDGRQFVAVDGDAHN